MNNMPVDARDVDRFDVGASMRGMSLIGHGDPLDRVQQVEHLAALASTGRAIENGDGSSRRRLADRGG